MNIPQDFQDSRPSPLTRIVEAAAELQAQNARLEAENGMLRQELEQARQKALYLQGRLNEAEKRSTGQHVENNFYNDRATTIRDRGLTGTSFHMYPLRKNDEWNGA